jgi:hypothetical protein
MNEDNSNNANRVNISSCGGLRLIGVIGQRRICQFVVIEAVDILTDESVRGVSSSYCGLSSIIKTTEKERRGLIVFSISTSD